MGEYENPGYGLVAITLDGDNLKMSLNLLKSPLRHFHYDIFEVAENPLDTLSRMKVMFATDLKGDIASLSMPLQPDVKDIVFTRRAPKSMMERSFLEAFAGNYALAGVSYTVELQGENTLVLVILGQPKYVLQPVRGATFDLAGLSGLSIEFKRDASGRLG